MSFRKADSIIVKEFPSSDGQTTYQVRKDIYGNAVCDCPGFKFRNTCKHVTACTDITVDERDIVEAMKDEALPESS